MAYTNWNLYIWSYLPLLVVGILFYIFIGNLNTSANRVEIKQVELARAFEEIEPQLGECNDADNDGLCAYDEAKYGLDPMTADTDGDGLSDKEEWNFYVNKTATDPLNPDTDGDNLNDGHEIKIGTNPFLVDTDGDGLGDAYEIYKDSDPLAPDTDKDGCSDGREIFQDKTNPRDADDFARYCKIDLNTIRIDPTEYSEFIVSGVRYEIRYIGASSVELKIKDEVYAIMYGETIEVKNKVRFTIAKPSPETGELLIYL